MDHCHTLMTRERRQTMDDELHSVVGGTAYIAYPEGSYPGKIPSDAEYFQDIEWDVSSDEVSVTEPPVGGQDRRGSPVAQDEHGGQVPAGPYTWSPYNPYDGTTAYQVCDRQYCADPEQP
ncbi:hypothetical protein H2199_003307 [Coniosporium tulheliwenetii]|uniref:Uncharacterized protein n=1 Tax=Coniosporium tulheliwenetii TaxID=3383036 RepID=A0ACC2ZC62_9PEZI|nr:hypothetical protein H2199_003307 [Cladosporium sp. JES 115]